MRKSLSVLGLIAAAACTSTTANRAGACTRAVYFGKDGQTVTGRSMDWFAEMHSNLYLFPRGMERSSGTKTPFTWTSKHGSVITSVFEAGTADGMNEAGLVANMNYLAESAYPPAVPEDKRPTVSIAAWTQWILDSFGTVSEAVEGMRKEEFRIVTVEAPTGEKGTVHVSISDPSGDSAIFQYLDGKLTVHHGREYQVMTNSPVYSEQLALDRYWKDIGGTTMLPGTNRASDRYVRASFYINAARQSGDAREAVATVFSVMRNVSVPRGITTEGQPNISSTIWRTVSDQKNKVYYFESTNSPSLVWVEFAKLDFKEGSGVRKIQLDGKPDVAGNQTAAFKPAEAFRFLVPKE
jgi:penicillin V acylase-like amidase (Ntn superfamily)